MDPAARIEAAAEAYLRGTGGDPGVFAAGMFHALRVLARERPELAPAVAEQAEAWAGLLLPPPSPPEPDRGRFPAAIPRTPPEPWPWVVPFLRPPPPPRHAP